MEATSDDAQRAKMKRGALVIGGLFALLVALYAVTWAITNRPAKSSVPLVKASELKGYGLEVVSVRARIKRVSSEQRDGKIDAHASAGFEDNRTGILSFPLMEPAEFARWRASFSEGDWVIVTGTYLSGGDGHDLMNCTIKPGR
jgi:hypothetical protein